MYCLCYMNIIYSVFYRRGRSSHGIGSPQRPVFMLYNIWYQLRPPFLFPSTILSIAFNSKHSRLFQWSIQFLFLFLIVSRSVTFCLTLACTMDINLYYNYVAFVYLFLYIFFYSRLGTTDPTMRSSPEKPR